MGSRQPSHGELNKICDGILISQEKLIN